MALRKLSLSRAGLLLLVAVIVFNVSPTNGGIIKDLFQKVTNTNNKTEDTVKESVPICGNGVFSTPNEAALSPELIFISTRRSKSGSSNERRRISEEEGRQEERSRDYSRINRHERVEEISSEFRFHSDNVTVEELKRAGFNADAPVSFLIHGFTSGYPLQLWISAIVEGYTIDRETSRPSYSSNWAQTGASWRNRGQRLSDDSNDAGHNLFIVNWNYAARGIVYPRAVANIPIVASYVTRFINSKLIEEAQVDPKRIQLIGHSLGAHLAGFVGKNTKEKVGRIYGLDPAGPCFGTLAGPLFPASKRLAPNDAHEVVTVQTNSALLGIEKPLGKYSVFVEGGANQPGCKPNGVLKSIGTLTWDSGDFDTLSCSHSRAPNLLTYRLGSRQSDESCQLIAYACKDWQSFLDGHCGVCKASAQTQLRRDKNPTPLTPVECYRIGLDWQYPSAKKEPEGWRETSSSSSYSSSSSSRYRPTTSIWSATNEDRDERYRNKSVSTSTSSSILDELDNFSKFFASSTRPSVSSGYGGSSSSSYNNDREQEPTQASRSRKKTSTTERPSSIDRERRQTEPLRKKENSSLPNGDERRSRDNEDELEPVSLFLRTSDTQPYCTFHYQVILEMNDPFEGRKKPRMSLILQDSEPERWDAGWRKLESDEPSTLSSDDFGHKFDEKIYTDLLTSNKRLARIDHATVILSEAPKVEARRLFKTLHVNYMSHADPKVRERLSSRLCPIEAGREQQSSSQNLIKNRFYFKPCDQPHSTDTSGSLNQDPGSLEYLPSSSSSSHYHQETNNYNNRSTSGQGSNHSQRGSISGSDRRPLSHRNQTGYND